MSLIRLYILLALMGGEAYEGFAPHYSKGLMDRGCAAPRYGARGLYGLITAL